MSQLQIEENEDGSAIVDLPDDEPELQPDGSAILVGSNSPLAANVAFVKDLPYDLKRDITPIAGATQTPWICTGTSFRPWPCFSVGIGMLAKARMPTSCTASSATSRTQPSMTTPAQPLRAAAAPRSSTVPSPIAQRVRSSREFTGKP